LLLDFDGTLTPIARNRTKVRLQPSVRRVLRRLAAHPKVQVYVISGRSLASLRQVVRVPKVRLLGLHGWERLGVTLPPEQTRLVREAKRWLEQQLPPSSGISLEDKGFGVGVHYRGAAPSAARRAKRCVFRALERFQPGIRLLEAKKSWELLPEAIRGKGATTQELLTKVRNRALPIFIGDDVSDESAFAVLRNGLAIHVGGWSQTKAKYWLRNPEEVREFLERLEAAII